MRPHDFYVEAESQEHTFTLTCPGTTKDNCQWQERGHVFLRLEDLVDLAEDHIKEKHDEHRD